MSVSVYIHCEGQEVKSSLLAGSTAARRYWLPIIESLGLELLDVIFTGGLDVTEEYYEPLVEETRKVSLRLSELAVSSPDAADAARRCGDLIDVLAQYPPKTRCRLNIG
jgi:hypothetical protein